MGILTSKFWRIAIIALIITTIVNSALNLWSIIDRRKLHMESDARAKAQVILIKSRIEGRMQLSDDELMQLRKLWKEAGYDRVEVFDNE